MDRKNSNNNSFKASLLLYDSDINMREMLKEFLSAKGYEVSCVASLSEGKQKLNKTHVDLMIIEIDSYSKSGIDTIQDIRNQGNDIPILCLGSTADKQIIVEAFDRGCDDYMIKPISMEVLVCHIQAILRRIQGIPQNRNIIQMNGIEYNNLNQTFNGVHINAKMGQILEILYAHKDEIVPKNLILAKVWMKEDFYSARSLSVYILHLRKLLSPFKYQILAYSKIGYRLVYQGEASTPSL